MSNLLVFSCDDITASKKLLEKANLKGYQVFNYLFTNYLMNYFNFNFPSDNFLQIIFQIGKTKVFLRAGQMAELDTKRTEVLGISATVIQKKARTYAAHKSFNLLKKSAIEMQSACRGKLNSNFRICVLPVLFYDYHYILSFLH